MYFSKTGSPFALITAKNLGRCGVFGRGAQSWIDLPIGRDGELDAKYQMEWGTLLISKEYTMQS